LLGFLAVGVYNHVGVEVASVLGAIEEKAVLVITIVTNFEDSEWMELLAIDILLDREELIAQEVSFIFVIYLALVH